MLNVVTSDVCVINLLQLGPYIVAVHTIHNCFTITQGEPIKTPTRLEKRALRIILHQVSERDFINQVSTLTSYTTITEIAGCQWGQSPINAGRP